MRVSVTIPANNEMRSVGDVVRSCKAYCEDVIVVDDGSIDDTAQVSQAGTEVCIIIWKDEHCKFCEGGVDYADSVANLVHSSTRSLVFSRVFEEYSSVKAWLAGIPSAS